MSAFQKATKRAVRARIALDGPSGSGKTWTALTFAKTFGSRTAVVDTERGSASLYADRFDFDVIEIGPPFDPQRLVDLIKAAEKDGYDTLVIDSLSHFWEGEGGVLDIVDAAGQRAHGNTYAGWKAGSPALRHLIDTILGSDLHVIGTMRSKTEYVLEEDDRGRKVPRKVGMAPVMRAGVEYEFTVIGDLDIEHRLTISKSRADVLADKVIQPGRAHEAAEAFVAWMNSGAALASRDDIDGLKQALNKIEPQPARIAAKKAFGERFGNPDYLVADKLDDAKAFVSEQVATQEPQPEAGADGSDSEGSPAPSGEVPAGADSREVGHTEPEPAAAETTEGADQAAPESSPAPAAKAERAKRSPAQQLHATLGKLGFQTDERCEFIYCASKGRTTKGSECTPEELDAAYWLGKDVAEGRRTLEEVVKANDAVRSPAPAEVGPEGDPF